jgi:type I restriction enzyme M protein
MRKQAQQIVQKLWSYCNILRDDGLSYPDYVEQLTYLLFLKMAHELAANSPKRASIIPDGYDWQSLVSKKARKELHAHYGDILEVLADGNGMLGIIFHKAENKIRDPAKLQLLVVDLIDKRNWSDLDIDVKGDAYEGLLEKNAQDTKSGAGQYFTPRPVIQAIVECVRPQLGEIIYDPASGTCGFLLAAYDYIIEHNPDMTHEQREHLRLKAFRGVELVSAVTRLGAMNMLLHGIGPRADEEGDPPIITDDSLSSDPEERYEVILTNPPFGKKSSITTLNERGERERQALNIVRPDFIVSTSNKQLNFLQHINTTLRADGRAAVVIPDNVLFEGGAGETIRRHFLNNYDVHTLLRLPPGIFYAQGIKTNVLFFDRKLLPNKPSTKKLWIYDLRTNMHFTLRTKRLERSDLNEFVACYSPENRNLRKATWSSKNPNGRWRAYTYEELTRRDKCNLDIFWLKDEAQDSLNSKVDPGELATEIMEDLQAAMLQISEIASDLSEIG